MHEQNLNPYLDEYNLLFNKDIVLCFTGRAFHCIISILIFFAPKFSASFAIFFQSVSQNLNILLERYLFPLKEETFLSRDEVNFLRSLSLGANYYHP